MGPSRSSSRRNAAPTSPSRERPESDRRLPTPRRGMPAARVVAERSGGRCFAADRVRATVADHHAPFGQDRFGKAAETAARFFGTPQYIVAQTLAVVVWIILNS